jgi:dipeptidyl-peptidase III
VTSGDFAVFMNNVVEAMQKAEVYAANKNQRKMVQAYVEHFKSGEIDLHKDSQRHWIKDIGPIVETNIGFIETYLDPSGARAEFEGFVSIVDKETSEKFNELVN